jgi:hypothetical protein
VVGTCAPASATGDADADGDGNAEEDDGEGDANGDAEGELALEGLGVVTGLAGAAAGGAVGVAGVLEHATTVNRHRLRQRYRRPPILVGAVQIEPLSRAVRTALSAARGVPSGLSIAHQYSSS